VLVTANLWPGRGEKKGRLLLGIGQKAT